jgi:hypothetical protein
MDVVYICRPGRNEELRYSIRSVVKNIPDARIWVVGGKPDWYIGNFIEIPAEYRKARNAKRNLEAISRSQEIEEEYILMNDDFFIMEPIENFDNYYCGTLLEKAELYERLSPNSPYTKDLRETYLYLVNKRNIPEPLNYEQHVPMKVTKTGMLSVIEKSQLHRSLYGNLYEVGGENMDSDVKVYFNETEKSFDFRNKPSKFLSCEDESFPILLREVLSDRFPDESVYEGS